MSRALIQDIEHNQNKDPANACKLANRLPKIYILIILYQFK
jgi:hypothetical protein